MAPRPVYIRGVAAVTPLGRSWAESAAALSDGATAIRAVRGCDVAGYPCTVAAQISEPLPDPDEPDRRLALLRPAAEAAWREAQLDVASQRLGVFIGAESGRASLSTLSRLVRAAGGGATFDHARFGLEARALCQPLVPLMMSPAAVAQQLAAGLAAAGPVRTVSLACASSAAAVAEAARAIRLGLCDAALCGGVGADVEPLMLAGFGKLGALSLRGLSCPFDSRRDGFVVGEGAAALVLSAERGPALVELCGAGRSLDGHHLTAPDPEGSGARLAMQTALSQAGLSAVDYVQAHGTSTPHNDAVEAQALRAVFGSALDHALVSSVKGALGHWVAGAGALGLLCAYHALVEGVVLPTAGLETPDPACALPHVMGRGRRGRVESALVNSFAFGGANCSLVLRRCA